MATGVKNQLLYAEQRAGRQWDFAHTFHAVGKNVLTADDIYFATRPNTFLLAAWKPADKWGTVTGGNASINAGIDQMAASIKSVAPNKVILSLNHEPENDVTSEPSCPASGGLKGYHVYRNGVYVRDSATTSFTDTGLTSSTAYSYTVVAFDSSANVSATSAALATSTTP